MFFLKLTIKFNEAAIVVTSSSTMNFLCKEGMIDIVWMDVRLRLREQVDHE
jgi:hypothetical protein